MLSAASMRQNHNDFREEQTKMPRDAGGAWMNTTPLVF